MTRFVMTNEVKKNLEVKKSDFITWLKAVDSREQAMAYLQQAKDAYPDARHHCYAFAIGKNHEKFRAADDGEPSNSAGAPILGQIKSMNLTNVLVVVVRYFGGTKLGVSGLIVNSDVDIYGETNATAASRHPELAY